MTGSEWGILLIGVYWVIITMIALFLVIPWCQTSFFRYRLWRVRDELYDDVRSGRLPKHPYVTELIAQVERAIRSPHMVKFSTFALGWAFCRSEVRAAVIESRRLWKTLTPEARVTVKEYEYQLGRAFRWKLVAGSPGAWMVATIFLPVSRVVYRLRKKRDPLGVVEDRGAVLIAPDFFMLTTHDEDDDSDCPLSAAY